MIKTSIAKLVKFKDMRDLQDQINLEILEASNSDLKTMSEDFGRICNTFVTQVIVKENEAIIVFTNEQERNYSANSSLVRF